MDLSRLNPAQRAAVEHGDTPLLVLAGAGTGKTTVITYRIANLLFTRGVSPSRILAVTFTNKAAREMRERTGRLAGLDPRGLDLGTFHGIAGRLLRRYGEHIGLSPSFVIYDDSDQITLIKRVLADLNIDPQAYPPRAIRHKIEAWKNAGHTPASATASNLDRVQSRALEVYERYEKALLEANAVDFGDLLLHTLTLLCSAERVREELRARWSHIFVDEYQDTNPVQYALLQKLVTPAHGITVVGDDDQAIYRWRGADINNILRFERDFKGASVIRLERNYRSTKNVLAAANALIRYNNARKGKTLYTEGDEGTKLGLTVYRSERDEGVGVADLISRAISDGVSPAEIGVLYRINAQSRPLEDALRRRYIPYTIYGGVRFYDRREVKDILAYLRLLQNPASELDFLRALGTPARGLGRTSIERLRTFADARGLILFDAARALAHEEKGLTPKARQALGGFVALIDELMAAAARLPLGRLTEEVLRASGYHQVLRDEGTPEAQERLANLTELVAAADEYATANPSATLAEFLEEVALATDFDTKDQGGGSVSLMTLHSAKGLEFELVLLPGMEEGLFPHSRSRDEHDALEEERRLCYVGITRAKRRVELSAASLRSLFGAAQVTELSRFLAELPRELLALHGQKREKAPSPRPLTYYDDPAPARDEDDREESSNGYDEGTNVYHASFGEGRVVGTDGHGAAQKLTIDFASVGRKVVVARFVERCSP